MSNKNFKFLGFILIIFVCLFIFCLSKYNNKLFFNSSTPYYEEENELSSLIDYVDRKYYLVGDLLYTIKNNYDNTFSYCVYDIRNKHFLSKNLLIQSQWLSVLPLKDGRVFLFNILVYPHNNLKEAACVSKIFNPRNNVFEVQTIQPEILIEPSLLQLSNGNILITGGSHRKKTVLEYDIEKNEYKKHKDLRLGINSHIMVEISNNKILLLGGECENPEVYNLNNDTSQLLNINLKTSSLGNYTKALKLDNTNILIHTNRIYPDMQRTAVVETIYDENNIPHKQYIRDYLGILDIKNECLEEIKPHKIFYIKDYDIELLSDKEILIIGGAKNKKPLNYTAIYNIEDKKLKRVNASLNNKRIITNIIKIDGNKYFIFGGPAENSLNSPPPEIFKYK